MFDQITILGCGLLGASIGMAAKERAACQRVHVWSRRPETRAEASAAAWADAVMDSPEAASAGSDLIVICTPVNTIVPLLGQIAASAPGRALVTDVGSTKSRICREAAAVNSLKAHFLGSHPMAGSEQTGMAHAREDLFQDAACILTPLEDAPAEPISRLKDFWQRLGMAVTCMSPEQHDEAVAHISHLPHLLSSALCSFLAGKNPAWHGLAGGGLRDTTRIAAGDPGLWHTILEGNREEVLRAISGLEDELQHFKSALANEDTLRLKQQLERGKRYRDELSS
ncbi:MAG: prephenate dehydrogenase [Opitutales bacterium]